MKNMDGLVFAVIVIVSIVAQLVKLGRRTGAKPMEDGDGAFSQTSPADAEDEIRKFLRELSGGGTPRAAPPIPPPPAPVHAESPAFTPPAAAVTQNRHAARASRRTKTVISRVVLPELNTAEVVSSPYFAAAGAAFAPPSPAASRGAADAVRRELREGISDPKSLQKAWVLREVLGSPISLRPYSWPHT